jgi:hypothetical protein
MSEGLFSHKQAKPEGDKAIHPSAETGGFLALFL